MILQKLALLGLIADSAHAKNSWSNAKFRKKFEKRLAQQQGVKLNRQRSKAIARGASIGGLGGESGFISAVSAYSYCGEMQKNSQYRVLKDFLVENDGKKMFYSHLADGANKVPDDAQAKITLKDDDTVLTYSNGWCDKNVYKSWNKCAVSGKCYVTCEDGNCYDEVSNGGTEIPVPTGCNDYYLECAQECSDDPKVCKENFFFGQFKNFGYFRPL